MWKSSFRQSPTVVDRVPGGLNELESLLDAWLPRVTSLGRNSRLEAESHNAKENGLEDVSILCVKRTIYEYISIKVRVNQLSLPFGRIGVFPIGVSFPNSTILTVNVQFCSLIPGDFPCGLNSFTLRVKSPRYAVGTSFAYSPFSVSGNDMLTFSGHLVFSSQ